MHLLSPFLYPTSPSEESELQAQREKVVEFLERKEGNGIMWKDKVMSPSGFMVLKRDGRSVLSLEKPGPELMGSGRGGDAERE